MTSPLADYLAGFSSSRETPDSGFVAYLASLERVADVAPDITRAIVSELADQRANLKLIASENYCSLATQLAQGNLLTDKYAEGIPGHRFYAGCENVDLVENRASKLASKLFGAFHAYTQPHSGADANMIAFWAILSARIQAPFLEKQGAAGPITLSDTDWAEIRAKLGNQKLLGLDLYSGGHLTHGYRLNVSGRMFNAHTYTVNRKTGLLDYQDIRNKALEVRPLILLAGYSAYPRKINFRVFKEIADEVGAVLMVDMAHFAGLVAGKVFTGDFDPVFHADIVTSTTHKTLRGPRGGFILCNEELSEHVDKGCPMILGGPLPHILAAKAVAFKEAYTNSFREYASRIVENAASLAEACIEEKLTVLTNGTDNHLILIDVTPFGLSGRQAEAALRSAQITLNRNTIPFDANGAWYTSGLRIGTPAITTLGMDKEEMREIAILLRLILENTHPKKITSGNKAGTYSRSNHSLNKKIQTEVRSRVVNLLGRFPLYPELDLNYLQKSFK